MAGINNIPLRGAYYNAREDRYEREPRNSEEALYMLRQQREEYEREVSMLKQNLLMNAFPQFIHTAPSAPPAGITYNPAALVLLT